MQLPVHWASFILFYFAVLLTAISHGLLQAPLPVVAARSNRFKAGMITSNLNRDQLVSVVSSAAALGVSIIWSAHERVTFLLPAVLCAGALLIAAFPGITIAKKPALESTQEPRDGFC